MTILFIFFYICRERPQRKYINKDAELDLTRFEEQVCLHANIKSDLHEKTVKEAIAEVKKMSFELSDGDLWTIITGKGLHSPNGTPVIKPAVENWLKKRNYQFHEDKNNSGRLIVYDNKRKFT